MPRSAVLAGGVVGVVLASAVAVTSGNSAGVARTGSELYDRIVAEAAAGDRRAQEQLVAVRAYMQRHGLSADDLAAPSGARSDATSENLLGVRLSIEDWGPWRIDIHNDTEFRTPEDVSFYRAARSAALDALGDSDANRVIDVAISPSGGRSVSQLAAAMTGPVEAVNIVVDIYAAAGWLMASGVDLTGRDFVAGAEAIESDVLDQAAMALDLFDGIGRGDIRGEVRILYARMPAVAAQELSRHAAVLAVDPLTDVADAFAGRAAIIEVLNAPELRAIHARVVLEQPIDGDPVSPRAGE